jgi:hypothetical protein
LFSVLSPTHRKGRKMPVSLAVHGPHHLGLFLLIWCHVFVVSLCPMKQQPPRGLCTRAASTQQQAPPLQLQQNSDRQRVIPDSAAPPTKSPKPRSGDKATDRPPPSSPTKISGRRWACRRAAAGGLPRLASPLGEYGSAPPRSLPPDFLLLSHWVVRRAAPAMQVKSFGLGLE